MFDDFIRHLTGCQRAAKVCCPCAVGDGLMHCCFNRFGFLHFPLGFYLLAQGLLVLIVVMAFWFIRIQERIDQARAESEEWIGQ